MNHRLLSIRELAQQAGVMPSSIYLIEAQRATPRMTTMRRLATALGVAPEAVDEFRQAIEAAKQLSPRRGRPPQDQPRSARAQRP